MSGKTGGDITMMTCQRCGKTCERAGPRQKYCPGCVDLVRRQTDRDRRTRNRIAQDRANRALRPAASLTQICIEAKAAGMTYGKYVAAIRRGSK